ncbi:MAG TPA: hypothetical protein VGJ45_19955 [Pseudonocardiaceae bacterium]
MTTTVEQPPSGGQPLQPGEFLPRDERKPRTGRTWLVNVLAILVALVIGALLMIFSDDNVRASLSYVFTSPGDFFSNSWSVVSSAYTAMFEGAIFNFSNDGSVAGIFGPISSTVTTAAPLICAGLGIALAFRSGLFNIGGQGQVLLGAVGAGLVGFGWHLPAGLHVIVAILAGIIFGAFWGFISGYLKARTGAHEVITTIMLNYVALSGLQYLLSIKSFEQPGNPQGSKLIDGNAKLPSFGSGLDFNVGIILAVAAALGVWWLLSRSTIGFRLRAVGANPAAARTAGMSVSSSTVQAMLIAGGLAGLAGAIILTDGATSFQVVPGIDSNVGFDAITVALLGRSTPWGTLFGGLLVGALQAGGRIMQVTTASQGGTGISINIVTVIEALIVIFIAAPRLIRALFRLKEGAASALTAASTNLSVVINIARKQRIQKHLLIGGVQIVLGVLGLWAFGLTARVGGHVLLQFALSDESIHLPQATFVARPVTIVLCLLTIVVGILRATKVLGPRWSASIAIFGLVTAFMLWSVAGSPNGLNIVSLLQGSLFPAAIPLILGGLAGIIGERAGVVNVALEGQLLLGAFVAAIASTIAGSAWVGAIGGMLAGLVLGALLAVLAIRYLVDQVIIGVVLNLFVGGVTAFLYVKLLAAYPKQFNTPAFFPTLKIPVLGDIPIIGPVFFDGTIFLYITYVLVFAVHFFLFHTRWGLRLRSVGEHQKAADTVGINVKRTRYRALLIAGLIAGLGGAFLVIGLGSGNTFGINMSSGKGYIALAAVIFGRWRPSGAVAAALLFGFANQLGSLLSQAGAPIDSNLLLTAPYIATIIAVAGLVGRVRPPASDGQPYITG